MKSKILFEETQQFRQWWMYSTYVVMIIIYTYAFMDISNSSVFTKRIFIPIFMLLMIVFLWIQKLHMTITDEYIEYSFFPLIGKRRVEWKDIQSAQMVTCGLLVGHGVRFTLSNGTMYNVSGRKAMQIQLKGGKKFAIGTQKPEELDEVLTQIFKQLQFQQL
jgi:hypothetical protein